MSRVMFLGAGLMQIPPIAYAKAQGHFVITVDYLPENPGHKYADEYVNLSVFDKEAILEKARELRIDGIVAYASDIAAPTAAYVAERLGLPGNPYESVRILTHKGLFRKFLGEHGFNCPRASSFDNYDDLERYARELERPIFVKPVDSSGSKGVTRVENGSDLHCAYEHALSYSAAKEVVVEETIRRSGYQVAGDGFVVGGELKFRCFANEHFDKLVNGLVPIGESFPSDKRQDLLDLAHRETQRLLSLLDMKGGALNFDFVFTEDDEFYFLELGPRNGGNLIPEVTRLATGVDMIKHTVDLAIGEDLPGLELTPCDGYWSSYIVHATSSGKLEKIVFSDFLKERVVEKNITAVPGQQVEPFIGANFGLGGMILRFDSLDQMLYSMDNMEEHLAVVVQ